MNALEAMVAKLRAAVAARGGDMRMRSDPVDEPDYIVIGAGSTGAVVAARLSEAADVLLLEAGGPSRDILYRMPAALAMTWFAPRSSWMLTTEPEAALGGSSAINGMVYKRGSAADYDAWAAGGLGQE